MPLIIKMETIPMPNYKVDGAKFQSLDELKESLWALYCDTMSREEFEKYIEDHLEITE
jgi:hypothetical protein